MVTIIQNYNFYFAQSKYLNKTVTVNNTNDAVKDISSGFVV